MLLSDRQRLTRAIVESTLQRPNFKPRKSTGLRKSFGPTAIADEDDDSSSASGVVTPKRGGIGRLAIQRNAARHPVALPARRSKAEAEEEEDDDARPSYSADALRELKESTPSTPAAEFRSASEDEVNVESVAHGTRELDLSSKFGTSLAKYQAQQHSSAIPSTAEIEEKKARRARLAKEQQADEYISPDPDGPYLDDDRDDNVTADMNGRLVLKEKDKWGQAESRRVRDDEDILEGFDDFTEDGKIHLGRKAEREAAKRRRDEMAAQIAAVEGDGSDPDDDASEASEKERNAAFEAAQTRHGTYGATHSATPADPYAHLRPKTPDKITPLPTLDGVIERLRRQLREMQDSRSKRLAEMAALQREKIRLAEEEIRIQKALRETAEKFAALRRERGIAGSGTPAIEAPIGLLPPPDLSAVSGQLAESVGPRTAANGGSAGEDDVHMDDHDQEANDSDEAVNHGHTGLGFAGVPAASGSMSRPPAAEDDW